MCRYPVVYVCWAAGGGNVDVMVMFVVCCCGGVLEYIMRMFNRGGLL